MRTAMIGFVALIGIVSATDVCQAGRRVWFGKAAVSQPAAAHAHDGPVTYAAPRPYSRYEYSRAMYPRYDADFHARHYQNIGVPTGDVGLRGNGITWQPW